MLCLKRKSRASCHRLRSKARSSLLSVVWLRQMATFDRRRINGPEESRPPVFDDEVDVKLRDITARRRKGRANGDIRPICTSRYCTFDVFRAL